MNIQRFLLPATVAAVFHAALLWGFPQEPGPVIVRLVKVMLKPLPLNDPVVSPAEEKADSGKPVRPLLGGPTPPVLDPPPAVPKPDGMPVPDEDRKIKPTTDIKIIPPVAGLGGPGELETGWQGPGVFSPINLDRVPRATVQPPPDYPPAMRQAGISGSVTVEFQVNPEGRVVRAEAGHCTHREFAEPAVRAVLKWRFEPGRHRGQAVPFRMAVPIQFGLTAG